MVEKQTADDLKKMRASVQEIDWKRELDWRRGQFFFQNKGFAFVAKEELDISVMVEKQTADDLKKMRASVQEIDWKRELDWRRGQFFFQNKGFAFVAKGTNARG
ncbi:hypothetical protein L6452_05436 [Arctium lappa]|uniref:Uncharacterized protein n=1 Tax=Arctium lappa TaxID=4217 RepID=A0ACB9EGF3_ARCLA|nr:hypothetical protein L6452_05436 [Arctium lappa]